jgi:hypothetical protein
MGKDDQALMVVRAELCGRVDRLQRLPSGETRRKLHQGLNEIRLLSAAYGLPLAARLAAALQRDLAEPRDCSVPLYLERLRDAIGCERADEEAGSAMLASVAVRLAG